MIHGTRITTFCMAILLSLSLAAMAAELTIPNSFSNGTAADAEQVNANFEAVKNAVNENNLKDGGVVNGPLTVPAVTYSPPKSASVTYSAMGFTPEQSEADGFDHATEFRKSEAGGFLTLLDDDGGYFYHGVTLRTGVTITGIRAHVYDAEAGSNGFIEIKLQKKVFNVAEIKNLATADTKDPPNAGEQVISQALANPEPIELSMSQYPASYYIEVYFGSSSKNIVLYSVTIDYEYTEP